VFAALTIGTLGSRASHAEDQPVVAAQREAASIASADASDPNSIQRASDPAENAAVRPMGLDGPVSTSHSIDAGWAADSVFYQVFTERFCNGDPANDPTRESLEDPDAVPGSWQISRWTSDWYQRADWEQEMENSFYGRAVYHRRYGGDLQGIINRLDYLRDLGINAIYLNPVFYACSLHKYDGNSFHHIDPYFGPDPKGDLALIARESADPDTWQWSAADKKFLELLRQAHARGMRVIIDGVFNHTGRGFFAFEDVSRHQAASRYKDWYVIRSFDDPATPRNEFRFRGWAGHRSLPEFADDPDGDDLHAGPRQYVFDITARWMDPNRDGDPSDGVDGWRLDVARDVPVKFWKEWNEYVRTIDPAAYTVAEIWDETSSFLKEGGFSSTKNYYGFAYPVKGFVIDGRLTQSEAIRQLDARRSGYPVATQFALLNLIDSHDTDRVASMIVNADRQAYARPDRFDYDINASRRGESRYDVRKPTASERKIQRLVALMQMTYVGPPMIYYGTEAGMWGADDPHDRMPMVWPDMTYDPQQHAPHGGRRPPDTVEFDKALYDYYRAVVWLRRQHSALRRGTIEFTETDGGAKFLAFRRSDDSETLLVALNRGDAEYRWQLQLADGQSIAQILTASGDADDFALHRDAAGMTVVIPPRDGVVLEMNRNE
jgi:glycosidase